MKTLSRTLLIAASGAALLCAGASAAIAQPPPGQAGQHQRGPGTDGQRGPGMRGDPARMEQRLHDELKITDAQEGAFGAFVAAIRPDPTNRPDPDELRNLTTPERLDRQLAQIQSRADAAKRLYAVLDVDQKAAFDALPPGIVMGGGPGGPGMMAMRERRGDGGRRFAPGDPDAPTDRGHGLPGAYDPQ